MAVLREAYNSRPMTHAPGRDTVEDGLLGFEPGGSVRGVFRPGGSKSLAQRALLAAAVARGTTRLAGLSADADTAAALALVTDLGATARGGADGHELEGRPPGAAALRATRALSVGESGTLARLATALVALAGAPGERWTVRARGSLLFRRSPALFAALERAGVALLQQNLPGTWPVELRASAPPARLELARPQSSQEVSALLFALAAHPEERVLEVSGTIPSLPYLGMSERLLQRFQVQVQRERSGERTLFRVRGPLVAPGSVLTLEPDASSAAVALAAACLSGGEVRVPGLGHASLQGDVRVVEHLAAFGCVARREAEALSARGFPERGAELDLAGEPDLAPVLAVVAAAAARRVGARSVLTGLATLPGKESDRLGGLGELLARSGFAVTVGADRLAIGPGTRPARVAPFDPRGDHRMAFACGLLGLFEPGLRCRTPQVVAKSWTTFWEDLSGLGARLVREVV